MRIKQRKALLFLPIALAVVGLFLLVTTLQAQSDPPTVTTANVTNTSAETGYGGRKIFATLTSVAGNALDFDGAEDYVNVGNDASLNVTNTLTIEAWVKPTNLTGRYGVFSTRINNDAGSFQLEIGTGSGGVNRVAVAGVATWVAQTDDNALNPNEWTHIAYTRSGPGAGTHKIYVNGVAQALVSNNPYAFDNNDSDKVIGAGTSGGQLYLGQIDELRVWSVARTETEINNNMHILLSGDEPSLVAYYRFDHDSGTLLDDLTANDNDGTLMNMDGTEWVSSTAPIFDSGQLAGHVYDAVTLASIEGATITADRAGVGSWSDDSDASGTYSMTVATGMYTVTAEYPLYTGAFTTGVEVFTDALTTVDFYLTPRGRLWGTVTDDDTGESLQGVLISVEGGSFTNTNAAGSYELYLDEGSYVVTATLDGYVPDLATVVITAGQDTRQDFALVYGVAFDPSPLYVTVDWQSTYQTVATLTNRLPTPYDFEFTEQPGGFVLMLGSTAVEHELLPSIPAEIFTGAAPAGYVPQPAIESLRPSGVWETRANSPFVSMDNVYVDYDGMGYQVGGKGTTGVVGIYDPIANSWTTGAAEPSPQIQSPVDGCFGFDAGGDPVAVLFPDTSSGATTLHRYNIATDAWDTPPVPAGFPGNGIWAHDIASVWRFTGENVCYISGGASAPGGGNLNALWAYYPDTNTAVNLGDFTHHPAGFDFHASWYAPWIGDAGGICVAGGVDSGNVVFADTQCYDIAAATFNAANTDLGAMTEGVWGMADGVLYEGGDYQLWLSNGADAGFALWPNSMYYSQNDNTWYNGPAPTRTVYRVEGVNIADDPGCSFYVVGGSTGGFSPSDGHERNISPDCPPFVGDVPWFGQDPVSGTVPASDTLTADMIFTATTAVGVDQPGDYTCDLRLNGDPDLTVRVTMTVLPGADMGKVEGTVLDNCTTEPVEAHIAILNGDPITETWSDPDTGTYFVWLISDTYDLVFSATGYIPYTGTVDVVAGMTVTLDVDLLPDRPCIAVEPEGFEVWVLTGTLVYTYPTGLDIFNGGGQDLDFELFELPGGYYTPTLATIDYLELPPMVMAGGINSLSGSFIEFDPSVGGDDGYAPGTAQTFCFRAESFTNDWEYVYNVWQRFPDNWTVDDVYVQGTPACDSGGMWGAFSWAYHAGNPFEINIDHARGHADPNDHCTAYYCFDVVSGAGGGDALASWYWDGDEWGGAPHWPCSDDGYTPSGQSACDEMIHPPAVVPIGGIDVPWFWEEPVTGTVPAQTTGNVDVMFTAVVTDPLPLGTYTTTMRVNSNDPVNGRLELPVTMHIVDQYVTPTAGFVSNSPVCLSETMLFTNSTTPGIPPETDYLWVFGDGMTSTLEHPTHLYGAAGSYTVTLQACNGGGCDTAFDVVEVLPLPAAGFVYTVDQLAVTFTNTSTAATAYLWAFGDGVTSTLESPVHTYGTEGTYTVTLAATGDCGSDVFAVAVTVGLAPMAGFSHNAPVCLGQVVTFTNTTTGTLPIDYLWDLGDSYTSTLEHPTHVYTAVGSYTVTLDASNDFGDDVAMDAVEVLPLPMAAFTYTVDGTVVTFTNMSTDATAYFWDLGDGIGTSTETHPVYTYAEDGSYTVTLSISGPCGEDETAMVVVIDTCVGAALIAVEVEPPAPVAGEAVTFTATATGTAPLAFDWDFGDGTVITGTGAVESHTYTAAGSYTATVRVYNACGEEEMTVQVVVVETCVGAALIAVEVDPPAPVAGEAVTFTASATGTAPLSFDLDFGDGTVITGTGAVESHTYTAAGSYTVTVTVSNACGEEEMTVQLVVVDTCVGAALIAVELDPPALVAGEAVTFTATATGTAPLSFDWDFGDGTVITGTGAVETHAYTAAGSYTVTVRVYNACGEEDMTLALTVDAVGYRIYLPLVTKAYLP